MDLYNYRGVRLPTIWEWGWASSGEGENLPFPGTGLLEDIANTANNGLKRTTAVGMYPAGSAKCGAQDFCGNVWEWCWDWFDRYQMTSQKDPRGPLAGKYKIIRGGSWKGDENSIRVANRGKIEPDVKADDIGFRVVRNL